MPFSSVSAQLSPEEGPFGGFEAFLELLDRASDRRLVWASLIPT